MATRTPTGFGLKKAPEGEIATSVYDNGRRGSPRLGCDCIQCFGYCMVDKDRAEREMFARSERAVVSDDSEAA